MQLDSVFDVKAPIDEVWATLMDFERVAACLPGAQVLNTLSDDAYQVGMKVKLGPMTMQYQGQLEVVERRPDAHRATLRGTAKEARGQGTAEATAQLALTSIDDVTHGTVTADVSLSGRAAAMGQGVINTVTGQLMAQFASNLEAMLTAPAQEPAPVPVGEAVPAGEAVPVGADGGPVRPAPTIDRVPVAAPADDNGLDALALAKALAEAQLREPTKALGLLAIVAFLAYLLGRRAGRRLG